MYWQPESECMDREELAQLQLERLESTLSRVYHERSLLPEEVRRGQVQPRRPAVARRPPQAALHHEERPPGQLSLRPVRRAAPRGRPGPRLVGNDRHVDCRRLFEERHQDLVEPGGAHPGGRRHHEGRCDPDRLQLRPVHRRLRPALRGRTSRRFGHSDLERQYPAPDPDHAGLQDHGAGRHAELRHAYRRHDDGDGHQSATPSR